MFSDPWIGTDQTADITDYNKRSRTVWFAGQGSGNAGRFKVLFDQLNIHWQSCQLKCWMSVTCQMTYFCHCVHCLILETGHKVSILRWKDAWMGPLQRANMSHSSLTQTPSDPKCNVYLVLEQLSHHYYLWWTRGMSKVACGSPPLCTHVTCCRIEPFQLLDLDG